MTLGYAGTIRNIISTSYEVYQKKGDLKKCLLDLAPILFLCSIFVIFAQMNHELWKNYSILMILMGSITFATLNTTLNLSRVTLLDFNRFSIQFILCLLPILLSLYFTNQLPLIIFGSIFILIVYSLFFISIVKEIADALKIQIFKIKVHT